MEFGEKLENLRKNKGLTQEELAKSLFVSRTAVSKWESGRGYPSIDSIKEISKFFSVSIDELLLGEKLISIAEKENKRNIRKLCDLFFGITDLLSFILIVLPLYPKSVNGIIYSVDFFSYSSELSLFKWCVLCFCISLVLLGIAKTVITRLNIEKGQNLILCFSLCIGIIAVLFFGVTRKAYAVTLSFSLLTLKTILTFKK